MKVTLCTVANCPNHGRYCRQHLGGELKEPKKPKPLSDKRQKIQKAVYLPLVKEVLAGDPSCRVKSPVCTGKAQGLHHLAGRVGAKLTDKNNVVPCCNKCNSWLEKNDAWARSNGWKLSKFSPENKKSA